MTNITATRHLISQQAYASNTPLDTQSWWLLGTAGCHLCNDAEQMLQLFKGVYPIDFQLVDIADFDEQLMTQFATLIPVVITPKKQLNFPFSLVDLQQLI
ncbi:thioredoxin family protein [Psychrobacter sp. FDAARGOS_221]|nr:thioredoxin family protein [Psychrobacter sp. FDAARGOS_221]